MARLRTRQPRDRGSFPGRGKRYLSPSMVHPGPGQHPAYYSHGTWNRGDKSVGGVKLAIPPSSTKVKNEGSCTSTPPCASMVCVGTTLPLFCHLLKYSSGCPDVHPIHRAWAQWSRPFVSFKLMPEDNIKIYCKEIRCELMDLVKMVKIGSNDKLFWK